MFNKTLTASYDELILTYNRVGKACKNWNEIKDKFCKDLSEIQKAYYEENRKAFETFEEESQALLNLSTEGNCFVEMFGLVQNKYSITKQLITEIAVSKIKTAQRSFKEAVMANTLRSDKAATTNTSKEDNDMYL